MTTRKENGPPEVPEGYEPISLEEFKRLAEEAKRKGESITPLLKRLVLSTIDEALDKPKEDS